MSGSETAIMRWQTRAVIAWRCGAIVGIENAPVDSCPVHPEPVAHLCQCSALTVHLCRRWRWHSGPCGEGDRG